MEGFGKEQKQKLMDEIHIPENNSLKLNPEFKAVLSESRPIAALTNLMTALIDREVEKKDKKLSETGQISLNLHCQRATEKIDRILPRQKVFHHY